MAENPRSARRVVRFSPDAEDDQNEIYAYTARVWGVPQAEIYLQFLGEVILEFVENPEMAPLVPQLDGVRVHVARWKNARYSHRIFFEETETEILILRILHTSRNWIDLLSET